LLEGLAAKFMAKEDTMKSVTVRVPGNLSLEQSQKVLATVLGKAGHPTCYSGLKISFENAVDPANVLFHVDKALNVQEIGG
jgi:hypothetical protein